ncbi:hypothetical protein VOLCADRAFT_120614 [Volvox carteri f. nagariensis]|uniref:Uncharacterized protein n=1 Tax=Volvox carteri f. nagariensis TaxID=3068 RepID=D8TPP2_VOLCA|nr:uncharacterized protein VOLCADRAFT_120614 [Volvox carteri f. nagariensis]EFJ50651.1 hypothetical protein VOLCADRAFT_120614 [Volvox carteri f. nagariensis]|eukprot:XP_002948244.1 hypothetical protein VOLCADRAFT_120614 [Volvox carteri f. nagariensis]
MSARVFRQSCRLKTSKAGPCPLVVSLARPRDVKIVATSNRSLRLERRSLVCRASAAQPSGTASARHAVLHDFCMCIPYGTISVLAGIGLFFLNLTNIAGTALIAGATSVAASVLSLQEWKAGGDSKQYTLISAVSAAAVAYTTCSSLDLLKGLPYWVSLVLCVLSVAASAFCAYNVLAGGNPPPKKVKGGDSSTTTGTNTGS